jgi:hypothetical protein
MKEHRFLRGRIWMLAVVAIVAIAGHGFMLYYSSSHFTLSVTVVSGVILVVTIKHLGLLGSLYTMLRRQSRQR